MSNANGLSKFRTCDVTRAGFPSASPTALLHSSGLRLRGPRAAATERERSQARTGTRLIYLFFIFISALYSPLSPRAPRPQMQISPPLSASEGYMYERQRLKALTINV